LEKKKGRIVKEDQKTMGGGQAGQKKDGCEGKKRRFGKGLSGKKKLRGWFRKKKTAFRWSPT